MIEDISDAPRIAVLKGKIQKLYQRNETREAVFSPADKQKLQGTAVAAAMLGLSSLAVSLSASDEFTGDQGHYLEFELDGNRIEAWVWFSVFNEGDEVEVVAEEKGNKWIGFAIRRTTDGVVAIHPHCERGSRAFFQNIFKWIGLLYLVSLAIVYLGLVLISVYHHQYPWHNINVGVASVAGATLGFVLFVSWRVSRRFKNNTLMANEIFKAFGWENPSSISLPKETKKSPCAGDSPLMGIAIFRYNP